jgi:hypothetical protein
MVLVRVAVDLGTGTYGKGSPLRAIDEKTSTQKQTRRKQRPKTSATVYSGCLFRVATRAGGAAGTCT